MVALIRSAALALALAVLPMKASGDASSASQPAFWAPPVAARWRPFITEASRRFGIPEVWIAAVMRTESAGVTAWNGRPITSRAGAMGLMQVMPGTWDAMRRLHHLGVDPYDPHDNILAGAAYLRLMHDRFGYPGLFAAYNAGPARYADHLATGRALPDETRAYVASLVRRPATPSMAPPQPFQRSVGSLEPWPVPPAILSGTRLFFSVGIGPGQPSSPESGVRSPSSGGLFVSPGGVPRLSANRP